MCLYQVLGHAYVEWKSTRLDTQKLGSCMLDHSHSSHKSGRSSSPEVKLLGIFWPKIIYPLEKPSDTKMKHVTCHFVTSPKRQLTNMHWQITTEGGKIFHLKGTEGWSNNKSMYYALLIWQGQQRIWPTKHISGSACQHLDGGLFLLLLNFAFKYRGRHSYSLIPEPALVQALGVNARLLLHQVSVCFIAFEVFQSLHFCLKIHSVPYPLPSFQLSLTPALLAQHTVNGTMYDHCHCPKIL